MRPLSSFVFAVIYAGGSVGPYATVEGRVLFGTVMAAGWGYLAGCCVKELSTIALSKWRCNR